MRRLRLTYSLTDMSENINQSNAIDRKMLNMNIPSDVAYWMAKWGVTREQLQNAVDRVGGKEGRIADYLRSKGIIRF